jgi:hypothetical protein
MALPVPANTTCDIYRVGNGPPSAPDVARVSCYLEERFGNIKPTSAFQYSHVMRVPKNTDIRDDYGGTGLDTVFIPASTTTTKYQVQAVARVGIGTALDHKIVYLNRLVPSWPTDNV